MNGKPRFVFEIFASVFRNIYSRTDAVRELIQSGGFNQCINKKSSSERCYYVRAEQTDFLTVNTLPMTGLNTEDCSYVSLS